MKGRRWIPLGFVLAIVLAIGLLAVVRAIPRLVAFYPAADAISIPAPAPLRLTFSRPMQPATVIERLTVDPPHPGAFVWADNTLTFTPAEPWPHNGQVHVQLEPGARASLLGLPTLQGQSWSFTVESTRLAYLWPHDGPADLYLLDPISGDIQRLTETQGGVLDFSVRADGVMIYFSAANPTGGSDLYRLDRLSQTTTRLLSCPANLCQEVQISPSGEFLAYQRTAVPGSTVDEDPQIRLITIDTGSPTEDILVAALSRPSGALAWSPAGSLLYHDPGQEAYIVHDPQTEEQIRFPNATGASGSWSPNGEAFIASEILTEIAERVNPATQPSHLIRYRSRDGSAVDLTQGMVFEDADPVFSPDGTRLAFARKYLDLPRWSPGRQLWVMEPDGSNQRPLTEDPLFNHKDFAWHADGRQLAYTRFNQVTLTDPPEIWLVGADGGAPLRLITGGYELQWIP